MGNNLPHTHDPAGIAKSQVSMVPSRFTGVILAWLSTDWVPSLPRPWSGGRGNEYEGDCGLIPRNRYSIASHFFHPTKIALDPPYKVIPLVDPPSFSFSAPSYSG